MRFSAHGKRFHILLVVVHQRLCIPNGLFRPVALHGHEHKQLEHLGQIALFCPNGLQQCDRLGELALLHTHLGKTVEAREVLGFQVVRCGIFPVCLCVLILGVSQSAKLVVRLGSDSSGARERQRLFQHVRGCVPGGGLTLSVLQTTVESVVGKLTKNHRMIRVRLCCLAQILHGSTHAVTGQFCVDVRKSTQRLCIWLGINETAQRVSRLVESVNPCEADRQRKAKLREASSGDASSGTLSPLRASLVQLAAICRRGGTREHLPKLRQGLRPLLPVHEDCGLAQQSSRIRAVDLDARIKQQLRSRKLRIRWPTILLAGCEEHQGPETLGDEAIEYRRGAGTRLDLVRLVEQPLRHDEL
mmetsp:Transcript_58635/g.156114  ORF Transcript_58635/g.156114 Transcript_58635/m.156114 type:complete len:359 (-) Transcript_58635:470-1546(-)